MRYHSQTLAVSTWPDSLSLSLAHFLSTPSEQTINKLVPHFWHVKKASVTSQSRPISLEKDQARHGDQTRGSSQQTTILHNTSIKYWLNESRVEGAKEHDKKHNQFRASTFPLLLHLREKVSCLCNGKWRPQGQSSSECLTRTCGTLGMLGKIVQIVLENKWRDRKRVCVCVWERRSRNVMRTEGKEILRDKNNIICNANEKGGRGLVKSFTRWWFAY